MASLPEEMKALRYEKPEDLSIVKVPLPELRDNDVLVQVKACGVCGTGLHIHEGDFIAKFPLIPGHETVGLVAAVGKDVKGFKVGDRVAADNSELCNECFYCRRGRLLLCESFNAHGVTMNGGFAEYCAYPAAKVFKIQNLSWVDATLLEPASCACHGLDKIRPRLGSHILMFGAGPTGLMLAQLLRQNGGCQVTIAAPKGLKMDLAKSLDAADTYLELSRDNPDAQFAQLKKDNPYGFDVVQCPRPPLSSHTKRQQSSRPLDPSRSSRTSSTTSGAAAPLSSTVYTPARPRSRGPRLRSLATKSQSLAPSPRHTCSLPPSTTSTRARSRPRALSTRRSSSKSLARPWRASRTRALSRPPSSLTRWEEAGLDRLGVTCWHST